MLIISNIFWNEIKTIIPQKKSKVSRPPKVAKLILICWSKIKNSF